MTIKSKGPVSSLYFTNFPAAFQTTDVNDTFLLEVLSPLTSVEPLRFFLQVLVLLL